MFVACLTSTVVGQRAYFWYWLLCFSFNNYWFNIFHLSVSVMIITWKYQYFQNSFHEIFFTFPQKKFSCHSPKQYRQGKKIQIPLKPFLYHCLLIGLKKVHLKFWPISSQKFFTGYLSYQKRCSLRNIQLLTQNVLLSA